VRLILRVEEMQRQMAEALRQNNIPRPGLRQGPGRRGNP